MDPTRKHEKIKLVEINSYLTCYLCKGYLIDATTISECLHSFCRSCIIKFLQENCYCPVCEVIINKAKPCLKLDKTLQDIVYKLVPELFVKEMYRRKVFYQSRPALWPKVTPEERGEDTERTIFNPQDAISLSIEYISDDSSPGAIPSLPLQQKTLSNNSGRNGGTQTEEPQDNPMKRYLQCPGMCRIDVLKKFVRNKYNVDTNLFHIDILYKRVPLPDHYTLIDIGYIYSWKRNEPMKFFFRITDINKVAERFDYFDGRLSPEIVPHQKPSRMKHHPNSSESKAGERNIKSGENNRKNNKETTGHASSNKETKEETKPLATAVISPSKEEKTVPASPLTVKKEPDKKKHQDPPKKEEGEESDVQGSVEVKEQEKEKVVTPPSAAVKGEEVPKVTEVMKRESANRDEPSSTTVCPMKKVNNGEVKSAPKDGDQPPPPVILKPEITEEIKNKIQSDCKNSAVYTNITLNRDDNVEIITKIQKVSNKEGHPIGLNIINHTVKKTNKVQNNNNNNSSVGGGSNGNKNQQKATNSKPSVPNNNSVTTVATTNNNNSSNSSAGDKTTPLTKPTNKKPEISIVENNINKNKKTDEESKDKEKEELEKSNFFKSIELTAKNPPTSPPQSTPVQKIESPIKTTTSSAAHSIPTTSTTNNSPKSVTGGSPKPAVASSSSAKRKNSSPVKVNGDKNHHQHAAENNKKAKIEKKPVKIIIQPKNIQNPTVRQMVSNVNQNVNSMSKIVEQSTTKTTDIQSLIDNCKIPASLSITLNEGGEGGARTPPSIPPVKNYIEILKLPDNNKDKNGKKKEEESKTSAGEQKTPPPTTTTPSVVKERNSVPTFQKIFEESIIKKATGLLNNNNNNNVVKTTATTKPSPLDLTANGESTGGGGGKRKILEIASQLQKKTKIEQEKAKANHNNNNNSNNKIAIPRLAQQRTLKPASATPPNHHHQSRPQTSASLHSPTLGMNYTVSVSAGGGERVKSPEAAKKPSASKPSSSAKTTPSSNNKSLSPNQLLEKYNIQNLAQLTAGFNFGAGGAGFAGAAGLNTALQHAMLLKQIEHQSWLNPGPLLQYEKYLQTLSATQNKIMGNIKEN